MKNLIAAVSMLVCGTVMACCGSDWFVCFSGVLTSAAAVSFVVASVGEGWGE